MKKVGKLIAVMMAVVMLVSAIAIPASAADESKLVISGTPLGTDKSFTTERDMPFFKLWMNNTGGGNVEPSFVVYRGSLSTPKATMHEGNHWLFFRQVTEEGTVPVKVQWPGGDLSGTYAVRIGTSVDALGTW